jgi:predicted DNA-binding WGR domain protein
MPPKKKGPGKTAASEVAEETPTLKAATTEAAKPAPASPVKERRRPVDREVPGREKYKVVADWDTTLNQTNVGANNNKFYIIQVLADENDKHYCWTRWGRVGEPGQNKLDPCGTLVAAISAFEKKFKEKTQNTWDKRHTFAKKDGKYGIVDKDEEEEGAGSGEAAAPMGKLSRAQIEKGQKVLEELAAVIESKEKNKSAKLEQLSSQFFTLIPTNFGRQKPQPITDMETVNAKDATLKFFLRMGFEEVETEKDDGKTPLAGIGKLPLPKTLLDAIAGACPTPSVTQSVNKGDILAKKKAGTPLRAMTKDEYGSILLYTSNAIYRELNRVLREEDKKGIKRFLAYLRLLLHSAGGLPVKPTQLYRGVSVDLSKQYTVGSTITWWGVSSCTSELQVAKNFAGSCASDSSLLTIDTKTACDISTISFYQNEKESLLMPGTQLKVISSKKNGKVAEIHLQEVGRFSEEC